MTLMDPIDSLWLAILQRAEELSGLDESAARKLLESGGFPEQLIEKYLKGRKT